MSKYAIIPELKICSFQNILSRSGKSDQPFPLRRSQRRRAQQHSPTADSLKKADMEISKLQNQIQAGALVRLTQEKINDLKKKDQIDGFPEREGYVKRVYNRYSPAVLDINFGNYNRYLNQNDVESAN